MLTWAYQDLRDLERQVFALYIVLEDQRADHRYVPSPAGIRVI
jgi:hypothetical protein